jgi:hypothetical protein
VARSTMEAEYIAAASLVDEVIWTRRMLGELNIPQLGPSLVNVDNQSTIAIAKEGGKEERRKHIDVKHHIIVEAIDDKTVQLRWIPSASNLADIFTKPLPPRQFNALKAQVIGADISAGHVRPNVIPT